MNSRGRIFNNRPALRDPAKRENIQYPSEKVKGGIPK